MHIAHALTASTAPGVYDVGIPCPPGTYNPLEGMQRFEACIPCGELMDINVSNGSSVVRDATYRGYYCPFVNSSKQVCNISACLPGVCDSLI